ncbi:MAG: hypothetical protein LBS83_01475 [Holosporales bacterium]|nr:hypothetical protein [Holosporales bacterium]
MFLRIFENLYDFFIIFASISLGIFASYQDIKSQKFSLWIGLGLLGIGGLWCIWQMFIPITLLPIISGIIFIKIAEKLAKKKLIGNGDLLLFCCAACFITLNELPAFMVFCGIGGILTCLLQMCFNIRLPSKPISFSKAERAYEAQNKFAEEAEEIELLKKSNERFPFTLSIIISQWITFFIYCY